MTIRRALAHEHGDVRELVRAAYVHFVPRIGREPMPMTDDYRARVAAGEAWVLTREQAIIGVLVLIDQPDALMLDNVAIAAQHQKQGHGRALIAFAEEEARRRGYATLRLYTNVLMTENIALYARLGFIETKRERQKDFERVFMEKRIG